MRVRVVLVLLSAGIGACTFDKENIAPSTTSQVVVQAILDPSKSVQEVLLERTLTGVVTIGDKFSYDPLDPINTGGGIPVVAAAVSISGPDGLLVGRERTYTGKPSTYGLGRYEFPDFIGSKAVRAGGRYTLIIQTRDGVTVTGSTVVPTASPVVASSASAAFNRDTDSLRLTWKVAPLARTYGLRIESPFGAFVLFSDSTHLKIPGTIRNLFGEDLPRLFIPGFTQASTVFAVDTNYFDYYRSRNDPFTGSGLISHLNGGIGLFGSVVVIDSRSVDVTQGTRNDKIEGTYDTVSQPGQTTPTVDNFRLYVETPGDQTSLSGVYMKRRFSGVNDGLAGARDGDSRIELKFLNNQDLRQGYATWVGTQVADSLIGFYNGSTTRVVFRRRP